MKILFGAENDGLHISPTDPNGYEWWYFDAVSDDERYVLVVIFFLGTPMSPYYKAVVDGKNPVPNDWCGVFVTLHERTRSGYAERAYAYNVYKGGAFAPDGATVAVGGSRFVREGNAWNLSLEERGLWLGAVRGNLSFAADFLPGHTPIPGDEAHTWVCVAPDCRVSGDLTLASGEAVRFAGRGYHDHNFGRLPWMDTPAWYWGRTHFARDKPVCGLIQYSWFAGSEPRRVVLTWTPTGATTVTRNVQNSTDEDDFDVAQLFTRRKRPIFHSTIKGFGESDLQSVKVSQPIGWSGLQESPFYSRFPLVTEARFAGGGKGSYIGIGELFRPVGLTGEIMSVALWTRIRRRS
ncbi:MAG: hypothetical protein H7Y38_04000 [Armatimonadetes bacterium]|nr:hypothetical protein [Armatimonadota bacterium]